MGWDHQERQKRLVEVGEYRPEVHRVSVHDTFEQLHLQMAAGAIRNGMGVSEFLLFAARYVLRNHRDLRHVARIFRKGAREIKAAVQAAPETERHLYHRSALERFRRRAWAELSRPEGKL